MMATARNYYCDDPEIIATVMIDGRPIRLKGSPEFDAFLESVMRLEPEPMFQQAVWLLEAAYFVKAGIRCEPPAIPVWGRRIVPAATDEAVQFVDSLYDLEEVPRRAAAVLLELFAKRFFDFATDRDPSLVPDRS